MRRALYTALFASLTAAAAAQLPPGHRGPLFHGGARPIRLGPTPAGVSGTTAEVCGACHAEIAQEWRASQHGRAWSDPVFQAAYAVEPMPFCRNCHAPLGRADAEPDERAAREAVSCAACHVRGGAVLATTATGAAPHASFATRALGESAFCAPCHQFNFPADPGSRREVFATDEAMQDTFEEFQASASRAAGERCQGCHMPWTQGADGRRHRSHAFPGGSDVAMLRRGVRVEVRARREGDATVVEARVLPGDIGHAFPTGDLFRRAELTVWTDVPTAPQVIAFAREFAPSLERSPRGALVFVRRQSFDGRVPPPGMGTIPFRTLRLPAGATRVRWRLDHLLMPTPLAASHGVADPRNRTLVHEGEIPLNPAGAP
ncbi:MAG: multiheme c-type cytochrome [Polyangiales bacterium]